MTNQGERNPNGEPLHTFGVIHLWCRTTAFFPYANGTIPAAADELETGRAPVTAHHGCNMRLVHLRRLRERADIEGVEIVIL